MADRIHPLLCDTMPNTSAGGRVVIEGAGKQGHSPFRVRVSVGPGSTLRRAPADDNDNVECLCSIAPSSS